MRKSRDAEMMALYDEGLSCREIGAKFQLSGGRVQQILKANGYTPRPGGSWQHDREHFDVEITLEVHWRYSVEARSRRQARDRALVRADEEVVSLISRTNGVPVRIVKLNSRVLSEE